MIPVLASVDYAADGKPRASGDDPPAEFSIGGDPR